MTWVATCHAVEDLGMSRSKLHELKRARALKPGVHWIKAGGTTGRLLWSIPEIRKWQVEQTKSAAQQPETYCDLPDAGGAA